MALIYSVTHMSLQVGIVGLPNVGKSTLFKALTKKQVDCSNYAFCTIEPNVGVVAVPDPRLDLLAAKAKTSKVVPTKVEFVDIAGLVAGASRGEGLGNKFLSYIHEVDAIVEVVRAFEDDDVVHVTGKIDPGSDIETIYLELIYADLDVVENRLAALEKASKAGADRRLKLQIGAVRKLNNLLKDGKPAREAELTEDEAAAVKGLQLLTMKPVLYVVNVNEEQFRNGFRLEGIPEDSQITLCVKLEEELADLSEEEEKEYLCELGIEMTGLDKLVAASYKLLGLITFFSSGDKENHAWTVRRGMKAPQAAGVIHTDFEKGFIRVEVINWKDFAELGEVGAKEKGEMRLEGRDYVIQDGDVCYFRIGV